MLKVHRAVFVALLLGIAGVSAAQAQKPGTPHIGAGGAQASHGLLLWNLDGPIAKTLALTPAQKTRILAIDEKYRPQVERIMQAGSKPGVAPRNGGAQRGGGTLSPEIKRRLKPLRAREMTEVRAVLTMAQRSKFDAQKEKKQRSRRSSRK